MTFDGTTGTSFENQTRLSRFCGAGMCDVVYLGQTAGLLLGQGDCRLQSLQQNALQFHYKTPIEHADTFPRHLSRQKLPVYNDRSINSIRSKCGAL